MNNYNHKRREIDLLQKIANITSLILELYASGKITEEVKNKLLSEVKR